MNDKATVARVQNRYAQIVELCREPLNSRELSKIMRVSRWTATTDANRLIEMGWLQVERYHYRHITYTTIRDDKYEIYLPQSNAIEWDVPDTPYLKFLMGYTALKPQIGTEYSDKFFDERKIGWNPDTGTRKERNAVSGSTLSMVI